MEKMKKYIIISIIIIIILIIAIIAILMYKNKSENGGNTKEVHKIETSTNFMDVEDKDIFYQVEDCIELYYKYLDINDYVEEEYFPGMELPFAQQKGIKSEEDKNNAIRELLDNKYIENNKIDKNNVSGFVNAIDLDKYFYKALKQKIATGVDASTIYVEGEILDNNTYERVSQVYYIVYIDYNTSAFTIYPLENASEDIEDYIDDRTIERNNNNYVSVSKLTNEDIAFKYFSDFKNSAIKKTDYAFNLLDSQYREIRFGNNKTRFDKYIDSNLNELRGLSISQYAVNNYNDYTEYVCRDKNGNYYIFKVTDFAEYTVTLDTYTIMSDKFKTSYDKANNEDKVMLNIDKWMDMLNNRDYTAAYNVLDETFRNNTFGSEEAFETYMRENYPLHYSVQYSTYKEEMNTFVQTIFLKDITNQSTDPKQMTIIMQLKDNYEFVMSFS